LARLPVRAWYVQSNSNCLFRACKIVDGWFRQLERLVRTQTVELLIDSHVARLDNVYNM